MKKKVMTLALMCCLAMGSEAQIYAGDSWVQLPTTDLYDTNVMNMHLRALAETAALRKEYYFRYSDMAIGMEAAQALASLKARKKQR